MSTKKHTFSVKFKTKVVLEALKNDRPITAIASAYNITTKNIHNWQKIFLDNAEIAMEPSKMINEYKKEIDVLLVKTNNKVYK